MIKLNNLILLSIVIAGLFLGGCKKSKDVADPGPVVVKDTLSVVLSGYTFIATKVEPYIGNTGTILVKGSIGNSLVVIHVDKDVMPGVYPAQGNVMYYADFEHSYGAQDGTITITQHDMTKKTISGTFEANLEDPNHRGVWIGAKNGVFGINY